MIFWKTDTNPFGLVFTFIIPSPLAILYANTFLVMTKAELSPASMFATHTLVAYPLISKIGWPKSGGCRYCWGHYSYRYRSAYHSCPCHRQRRRWTQQHTFGKARHLIVDFRFDYVFGHSPFCKMVFNRLEKWTLFALYLLFFHRIFAAFYLRLQDRTIIGALLQAWRSIDWFPIRRRWWTELEFIGNALFIPFLPY